MASRKKFLNIILSGLLVLSQLNQVLPILASENEATSSQNIATESAQTEIDLESILSLTSEENSLSTGIATESAQATSSSAFCAPEINASLDTTTSAQLENNFTIIKKRNKKPFLAKNNLKAGEKLKVDLGDYESDEFKVVLYDSSDQKIALDNPQKEAEQIVFDLPNAFRPGKYHLKIVDEKTSEVLNEQDFEWGVLALNMNKSIYLPGETAYLAMAVLDEQGRMVCDAGLTLKITNPKGEIKEISTEQGTIKVNPECQMHSYTEKPDYEAFYQTQEVGAYQIELLAETQNGSFTINDFFEVHKQVDFDIERSGPTRIYPPSDYPVEFKIKVNRDFEGIIEENVPSVFEVLPLGETHNKVEQKDNAKIISWFVSLKQGEEINLAYRFKAPDISPQFYLLGPLKFLNSGFQTVFEEGRRWQIAADPPSFRVNEYWLSTGDFTGTTYDLSLSYDLADNYFILVRGSRVGDDNVTTYPDNDFIRVAELPGGKGDLPDSGAADVVGLSRWVNDYDWEGVVTVVECLGDCNTSGFTLLDVAETTLGDSVTSGSDTSSTSWSDINQVVLFGGIHGGGAEFDVNASGVNNGNAAETRLYPSSTNVINWARNSSQSRQQTTITTFVVEWGSDWEVHHINVSATDSVNNDGCDAIGEYHTASLGSSVNRSNTWVWGTGNSNQAGIGDNMESTIITLGDGVNQGTTESVAGWCGEYAATRDMDIYTMTNSGLAVDYRFKTDGDSTLTDVNVTVDTAANGQRFAWVTNGCNGSGNAHPRDRFSARYTADTTVTLSRGRSGQNFPAWVEGIDFTGVTYLVNAPYIRQNHYRWRDDTIALNTDGGWTAAEDLDENFIVQEETVRLRFKVVNTGLLGQSTASTFEIQWGDLTGEASCDLISTWTGIGDASDEFAMVDSSYITPDGQSTTVGLLSNIDGYTWIDGEGRDISDTTSSSIGTLDSNEYTELEYSIEATTQTDIGTTYCFRLYDTTADSTLDFYTVYPRVSIGTLYDYLIETTNGGPNYRLKLDGNIIESISSNSVSGDPYGYVSTIIPNYYGQSGEYTGSQETVFTNETDVNSGTTTRKIVSFWTIIDTFGIGTGASANNIWEEGGGTNWWNAYTANNDSLYVSIGESSTQQGYCYESGLATGTLYHVVMQWEGSTDTMELWINGSLACSTPTTIGTTLSSHTGDWEIAGASDAKDHTSTAVGGLFDGKISDYVYWAEPSRFLTQSEIEDIYNAGVVSNQNPNSPSSLVQKKQDDTILATGDWLNETSVKFTATASDPDSSDTLYLCVEKDQLGTAFSDTEDLCGSGVAYSGTPVTVIVTITGISDQNEYHWQARVKDEAAIYSSWVSYDTNGEGERDFGLDGTAPTGGTVYDGSEIGVDIDFNNSSLSELSANWGSFDADISGLDYYEYSVGTSIGGTEVSGWVNIGVGTSVNESGLDLQTSTPYYFNVRAIDNAGNTQSAVSSDGQVVSPSLTFSVAPSVLSFDNLNSSNSYTSEEQTTLTTSTNAYGGYVVRSFVADYLRSSEDFTIDDFDNGTYESPGNWGGGNYGFGYTSSDTTIQGSDKFSGGTLWAPFSQDGPGDIVADYTDNVTGTPIVDDQYTVTYKVKTDNIQESSLYVTTAVYTVTAMY